MRTTLVFASFRRTAKDLVRLDEHHSKSFSREALARRKTRDAATDHHRVEGHSRHGLRGPRHARVVAKAMTERLETRDELARHRRLRGAPLARREREGRT